MINKDRLLDTFIALTALDSESRAEAPVRDYLMRWFKGRAESLEEDSAAAAVNGNCGNVLVRLPGSGGGRPLLFSCHMDTVKPGRGIKAALDSDNIIRGAGDTILGSDDKAGIAAILEAVTVMEEQGIKHPPLELLFTVCEEQGLLGARHFDLDTLRSAMGFVLDSSGAPGSIVVQSPSQYELNYYVTGKAAHAGMCPEMGLNAIQVMAQALAKMPCGRVDEETTCNFGMIEGGQARNAVAAECHVKGEARSLKPEKLERLADELSRIFTDTVTAAGAQGLVERVLLYSAVDYDPEAEVVKLASQAAAGLGLPVSLDKTGGGSDASVINRRIPCVNLGIGMSAVHTVEEYISWDDMADVARWIVAIVRLAGSDEAVNPVG
ncbi:MAG: M20/M25/M40 family metallo-hydrolase [Syntrophomonadaceae bacterium]|nr:M20/M25/M40 family metallo-hydrolase [Syntrophomonadaceae bacterium]